MLTDKLEKDFFYGLDSAYINVLAMVVSHSIKFGLTLDEVDSLLNRRINRFTKSDHSNNISKKSNLRLCPLCSDTITTMKVNTTKCTMVGNGYTKMDTCNNNECEFTKFY